MGSKYKGNARELQALNAYIALLRGAQSLAARVNGHLINESLSAGQFGALEALLHLGPLCQKELASKLLVTGGNITMVVDNLEKQGLIRRTQDPEDRRRITVALTSEGKSRITKLFEKHVKIVVNEMSVLNTGEQELLRNLCKKVGIGRNKKGE